METQGTSTNEKKPMSILIKPENRVLIFPPSDGKDHQECYLKIQNQAEQPVAFKFRTNKVETYRVRPAVGILKPGKKQTINIFKTPATKISSTDKLVLISTLLESDATVDNVDLDTIWFNTPKDTHQQQTILVGQTVADQTQTGLNRTSSSVHSSFGFPGVSQGLDNGKGLETNQVEPGNTEITQNMGVAVEKHNHHCTALIPAAIKQKLSKSKASIERSIERLRAPFEAYYVHRKAGKIMKYPGLLGHRAKTQLQRLTRKFHLTNIWVIAVAILLFVLIVLYFSIWENLEKLWQHARAQNCFSRHPLLSSYGCYASLKWF